NDTNDNMSNFKSRENMYSLLSQEKNSSTKKSWDNMVSQDESHLLSNTSTQKIDNGQNNNKEHMPEISPEKKVNHANVPEYGKPDVHTQNPDKENVLPLENMQTEASLQISSNLIQALLLDITQNIWSETVNTNAERDEDLCDELTMDNPFSRQNSNKSISTNSEDTVMETTINEAEFTTVVNKKKKNKTKSKST
ncbi:23359_t:CDS:2, partial [Gigaspora rosea]